MTLLDLSIELTRTNEFLSRMASAEERIADALERLSPPLQDHPGLPYKAGMKDLIDVSPSRVSERLQSQQEFANRNDVIHGSDAFRGKVMEYEAQIRSEYGEEGVSQLPWNKK